MLESAVCAVLVPVATAALGWSARRRFVKALSDEELMAELKSRGIDLEHHAMESYVNKTYEILSKLGEGASGEVWRVRKKDTKQVYAMKKIRKSFDHQSINDQESLAIEIKCLRKLRHRHIVNLIEVVESEKLLWIIMECADGGGLYDRVVKLHHYSERSAAHVIKQVLKAVHYMHSMGVVHRDLKPENILLDSTDPDADVKIADFGLAVVLGFEGYHPEESMRMKKAKVIDGSYCGSPICMAPEVARRHARYGPQCDIWSVGCLAYELVSGHPPFSASSATELFRIVQDSTGPPFNDKVWKSVSPEGKDLVSLMLKKDPEERPSAKEALNHAWFQLAPDDHRAAAHNTMRIRRSELSSKHATRNDSESS